jgi:hypothetical protein
VSSRIGAAVRKSNGFDWAYRDLLTALLVVFIAMAVLSLIATSTKANPHIPIQGNLIIEMRWDALSDSDIDLWVQSPGDSPVGFERPSGLNCNLLRDDLGRLHDPSSENEEMTVCRNAPAGDYAVNVMAYDVYDGKFPVDVTVEGTFSGTDSAEQLFSRHVKLTYGGQELTVARFRLDGAGDLVDGSMNDVPIRLYRRGSQ